ncbi:hypothetical protein ANN_22117 [Periplaneta americana]|uniref:Uncharacterized protein n=1 Tax=Periplaneta americana TaxID=6978 RepID=A0ABQ8S791_PERAM|nr:hypothetical protein ANN_22117 [Periplaneta americana]
MSRVLVITEDVQNVHLLLEYRPHIDVSLTYEHDPKLQEYCVCPQNMPQFDSEGIPNQAPETNKPMILNGPTSRNREGSDQKLNLVSKNISVVRSCTPNRQKYQKIFEGHPGGRKLRGCPRAGRLDEVEEGLSALVARPDLTGASALATALLWRQARQSSPSPRPRNGPAELRTHCTLMVPRCRIMIARFEPQSLSYQSIVLWSEQDSEISYKRRSGFFATTVLTVKMFRILTNHSCDFSENYRNLSFTIMSSNVSCSLNRRPVIQNTNLSGQTNNSSTT